MGCIFVPGIAVAYLLSRKEFVGKHVLSALATLPLVLPPTAVGYLLLKVFAERGLLGRETLGFDVGILLTGKAVIFACSVMAFPIFVRTAKLAFDEVEPRLEDMGKTLGMGGCRVFFSLSMPLASRGLVAAILLGFARSMGEFGATVIIAGNIPGKTQTLASAIFTAQQRGDDDSATTLLWVALIVGFAIVYTTERLSMRQASVGGSRK
jgi:molybdate transport system permease protein